ncbi:hypothetical protein GOODEAATRI_015840 [Goodea atripinnis]|uniref:Secreted protein n=1 Tax=Goodea atripinnis TaxID=208336 RepID=A0ABV0MVC6_9TELE
MSATLWGFTFLSFAIMMTPCVEAGGVAAVTVMRPISLTQKNSWFSSSGYVVVLLVSALSSQTPTWLQKMASHTGFCWRSRPVQKRVVTVHRRYMLAQEDVLLKSQQLNAVVLLG